jgi:hypothetical protein
MSNHTKEIRSLENSISVYTEYKSKVGTSHLTDELKQIKVEELTKQIKEAGQAIQELKES